MIDESHIKLASIGHLSKLYILMAKCTPVYQYGDGISILCNGWHKSTVYIFPWPGYLVACSVVYEM